MRSSRSLIAALLAGAVLLGACGDDDGDTPAAAPTTDAVPTTDATTPSEGATTGGGSAAGKVSANNASEAELVAAFEKAGIANADKWAEEVEEYRPYDPADTDMARLREELAKYNPPPGAVDAIVATLSLP